MRLLQPLPKHNSNIRNMSNNINKQSFAIQRSLREDKKQQKSLCIWITGLSGAGKSTIANHLELALHEQGKHTYILDGDNIRAHLNSDLGFSEQDRLENIRRIAEVARLMVDAGLIVVVASISPYARDREAARNLFSAGDFIEVYVNTPLAICEQRDHKGLYARAHSGQLPNFTGVNAPYEIPANPDVTIDSDEMSTETAVKQILKKIA